MATFITQVTLGSGATQVSATNTPCRQITFQNNASHNCRIGDSTVTTSKGILLTEGLTPTDKFTAGPFQGYNTNLTEWYIAGTSGDVIDVLYSV